MKKIILMICLVICVLFTVSSVCANDLAESDMDDLASGDDIQVIEESDDGIIGESDNGSFQALQDKINNAEGSTITLENNYEYDDFNNGEGIDISRELTIDGKGYEIDAKSASRIFKVSSNAVLKNITFKNGYINGNPFGGAILNDRDANLTIIGCVFKNCTATSGGAIGNDGNCSIMSCNFTECSGRYGGALNSGGSCSIISCNFTRCYSSQHGGAIYIPNQGECNISSSNFISCYSKNNGGK